jgi:predicted GNAT family N-acyltransferase
LKQLYLHAQVQAIPFYNRFGFTATGEPFMEAGIVHQTMERFDHE